MAARFGHILAAALALAGLAAPGHAQDYSNSYSFLKAVKERDGTKVASLLSAPGSTVGGAKDGSSGNGALHLVTLDRDANWLGFLVGKGMKVDARNARGDSPLSLAAQIGWVEGADILLRRSASVDLANGRGETPLIVAVQRRDLAMTRLLLSRGADPKRSDSVTGYSALDHAKRDGRSSAIVKLLETPRAAVGTVQGPTL